MLIPKVLPVLLVICTAGGSNANAYCSEPFGHLSLPDPPSSLEKPSVPYCLSEYSYSQKHTCDQWEIDSYYNEVNSYIGKLNDYIGEMNDMLRKANSLTSDAVEYANCEAEDVKSQHE